MLSCEAIDNSTLSIQPKHSLEEANSDSYSWNYFFPNNDILEESVPTEGKIKSRKLFFNQIKKTLN